VALMHVEDRLGASWVCQKERWGTGSSLLGDAGTLDGFVPVRIAWMRFQSLGMHRAVDVQDLAQAIGVAFASENAERIRNEIDARAYPEE
jgi:hypothetical protein